MDGVVEAELASGTLIVEAKLTAGLQEIAVSTAGEGRQERLESHDSRVQSQDMGSSGRFPPPRVQSQRKGQIAGLSEFSEAARTRKGQKLSLA